MSVIGVINPSGSPVGIEDTDLSDALSQGYTLPANGHPDKQQTLAIIAKMEGGPAGYSARSDAPESSAAGKYQITASTAHDLAADSSLPMADDERAFLTGQVPSNMSTQWPGYKNQYQDFITSRPQLQEALASHLYDNLANVGAAKKPADTPLPADIANRWYDPNYSPDDPKIQKRQQTFLSNWDNSYQPISQPDNSPVPTLKQVINPAGVPVQIGSDDYDEAINNQGYLDDTPQNRLLAKYRGISGAAKALALGAANGPTLGLAGAGLSATGLMSPEEQAALQAAQPAWSTAGEVGGLIAANFIPGVGEAEDATEGPTLASSVARIIPSNIINDLGEVAGGAAIKGTGIGAKLAQGAVTGATQGTLYSVGQTVSDSINNSLLGDPQQASENIMAGGAANALISAAIGGTLGSAIEGGFPILKDIVAPQVVSTAKKTASWLSEDAGRQIMDLLNMNPRVMANLYGDDSVAAVKEFKDQFNARVPPGVKPLQGNSFAEVMGDFFNRVPKQYVDDAGNVVPPGSPGAMPVPFVKPGDTPVTFADTVQELIEQMNGKPSTQGQTPGSGRLGDLETMDKAFPMEGAPARMMRQDLQTAINDHLISGNLSTEEKAALTDLRETLIGKLPNENLPSAIGALQDKLSTVVQANKLAHDFSGKLDPAARAASILIDVLGEAIDDKAGKTFLVQTSPNVLAGYAPSSNQFSDFAESFRNRQAMLDGLNDISTISAKGAQDAAESAPTTLSVGKAAMRGMKSGLLPGFVGGHGVIGAGVGAMAGAALEAASQKLPSYTMGLENGASELLSDLAETIPDLVKSNTAKAIDALSGTTGGVVATVEHEPLIPADANEEDLKETQEKLAILEAQGINFPGLDALAPQFSAGMNGASRRAAHLIRMQMPKFPGLPGSKSGMPSLTTKAHINDYHAGVVDPHGSYALAGRGMLTSSRAQGTRDMYPTLTGRAVTGLVNGGHLSGMSRSALRGFNTLTNGRDPFQGVISSAGMGISPNQATKSPRGSNVAASRIDKIGASDRVSTATQHTNANLERK